MVCMACDKFPVEKQGKKLNNVLCVTSLLDCKFSDDIWIKFMHVSQQNTFSLTQTGSHALIDIF